MFASRTTLSLLGLCLAASLAAALPQGRLLGSEDAKTNEFPWVASLRLNKAHICSANIISDTQLLTAAHCVSDVGTTSVPVEQLTARVGSINQFAGGSLVDIKHVAIHPSYGNFLHDLAILTLSSPLTFSEKINKIPLPAAVEEGSEEVAEVPANGTPVYVTGWGEQLDGESSYKLQKSNLNTLSKPYCELAAGYGYDSVLCLSHAENEGVCRGDDGGSVVDDDGVLIGVVSFFFGNCGTKYPDVSSRISYYLDWIEQNKQ
ncbi:hypothetical protein KR044_010756 [Drosophila immigrans]|nr:hypothetical protein KR044_010756 [Drosophila immigrans]